MSVRWNKDWLRALKHSKQMTDAASARDRKNRRAEWWRDKWVSVAALLISVISLILSLTK